MSLATPQMPQPGRWERWFTPTIGAISGLFNGLVGIFAVPGVLYLQALGWPRDTLIQAMGLLFTVGAMALGLAFIGNRLISVEQGILSVGTLLPAALGMVIGQNLRRHLSEEVFRKLFFLILLMVGAYIATRAFY